MFDRKAYQREYSRRRYQELSIEDRKKRNSSDVIKRAKAKYRSNPVNRAKEAASCSDWYHRNKNYKNTYTRLKKYNLTIDQYTTLKNNQGGVCAICNEVPKPNKSKDGFVVDHNHETGEVRGLLCNPCNIAIGLLSESPSKCELAASYLRRVNDL